jgi:hypothetical protein
MKQKTVPEFEWGAVLLWSYLKCTVLYIAKQVVGRATNNGVKI